jgi:isopenicillin-N epimerase
VAAGASLRGDFFLDPEIHFLNHGSFGACPRPVMAAYQSWQLELERQPCEFFARRSVGLLAAARAELGRYVGCAANDVVYVTNSTVGVNVVARSLALRPGDVVLGTDHEYGACDRVWRFLCAKAGAEYRQVAIPVPLDDPRVVVEAVRAALDERVRLLFFSHITSPTALVLPAAELVKAAHAAGIPVLIDGAHAPSQLDLDLAALGVDYYTGNCHKWLCAPKGAGFLYARPDAQAMLEPLVVSWGWHSPQPTGSTFVDEQEYGGTRDLSAFLTVPTAIGYQAERSWPAVRERCHELVRAGRERLLALPGVQPVCADDARLYRQMVAVSVPRCVPDRLVRHLFDVYAVEVAAVDWNDRTLVRISAQAYNEPRDIDALLAALPPALAAVEAAGT